MSVAAPTLETTAPEPSFRERFVGVITRPRETFQRLQDPDAWFWPAVLFLIGYTVYYLAIGMGMARFQNEVMTRIYANPFPGSRPMPPSMLNFMQKFMPGTQVFSATLQVPFAIASSWATRTVIFYVLARALGGSRPFWGRVVAMVGWAWVPIFLQYVLFGVAMMVSPFVFNLVVPLPKDMDVQQALLQARNNWHLQVLASLSPFVLWNLVLCVIGVQELFNLPRWKAAVVVLVPTVFQLVFHMGAFFLYMWMAGGLANLPGVNPAPPPGP